MQDDSDKIGTDNEIIKSLVDGDRKTFEALFHKYYSLLCDYALTYLEDANAAEDIVQDVFVYLWNHCKSIAITTSLKSYLYSSVKHSALNVLKHQAIVRKHSPLLVEFWAIWQRRIIQNRSWNNWNRLGVLLICCLINAVWYL